jgi:hypothetical protein
MPVRIANSDPFGPAVANLYNRGLIMRSINWLENTSRSVSSHFPKVGEKNARYIADRLSILLLERLSAETAKELISLLPEDVLIPGSFAGGLKRAAQSPTDHLVGYPDFVDVVSRSFFSGSIAFTDSSELIADFFLWAIAQELTSDLKWKLIQELPADLRSRMNLYTGESDDSKVA